MNDITQLSTLYSNAIARAEKAEEALRVAVLAERERCSDVAEAKALDWVNGESVTLYGQGFQAGCRVAARAIRRPPPPVRETP